MTRTIAALPSGIREFRALSPVNYRICDAIIRLKGWAYGQRITDKLSVAPSIIYISLKRMQNRGLIRGQLQKSPDGSDRNVRIYKLEETGLSLFQLADAYYRKYPEELHKGKRNK